MVKTFVIKEDSSLFLTGITLSSFRIYSESNYFSTLPFGYPSPKHPNASCVPVKLSYIWSLCFLYYFCDISPQGIQNKFLKCKLDYVPTKNDYVIVSKKGYSLEILHVSSSWPPLPYPQLVIYFLTPKVCKQKREEEIMVKKALI